MNLRYAAALASLVALLLCSCASSGPKTTLSSPEYQHAVRVFGGSTNLLFLTVPSSGPINDSLVSGLSAAGPSALSRQIAEIVASAGTRKLDLAVTGASPRKTKVSLIKGLEVHKGRQFPNLHLLYIGQPADRREVEEAVRAVGGQFSFTDRSSL